LRFVKNSKTNEKRSKKKDSCRGYKIFRSFLHVSPRFSCNACLAYITEEGKRIKKHEVDSPGNKEKSVYQIDKDGQIIKNAVDFRVVDDK
jgi:hypothetical protein